jgi:mono/diheme cytochrome c family protein
MEKRFGAAGLLLLAAVGNSYAADPENGLKLAELWCAQCHVVSSSQRMAATDTATFREIAQRFPDDLGALAALLSDEHPPMPDMSLTREEIRDLVAYIASVR